MGTFIRLAGDELVMTVDGVKYLFHPTGKDVWVNSQLGSMWIQPVGNMLAITAGGNTTFALQATGNTWITNLTVDPGTDVFKWPFSSTGWTTYPMHSGLDWPEPSGTIIPIIGPGTVIEVYANNANTFPGDSSEPVWRGNCIVVDHGTIDGIQISSLYAHMLTNPVFSVGDPVTGGQTAGRVGNSGYSDGAHLHFEIIYDGDRLDNSEGGGAERAEAWMNAHTDGSNW